MSESRSHLVETFIDSEFWRDTVGAELYAAILDQLKLAEQVEELRRENAELSETIIRFQQAAKVDWPDFITIDMPLTEQQPAYIKWLEGKVSQLQSREQLVHEQGRDYAAPKLENRTLRAEKAELERRLAMVEKQLVRDRTFIEYARYELEDFLMVGAQFPSKQCADKEIININEALRELRQGGKSE